MARARWWCKRLPGGKLELVPLMDKPPPREPRGPAVHTDTIDPLEHPMDARLYDSKSEFRKTTKRLGGLEVGNEKIPRKPKYANSKEFEIDIAKDVDKAYGQAGNLTIGERENIREAFRRNAQEFTDVPTRYYDGTE